MCQWRLSAMSLYLCVKRLLPVQPRALMGFRRQRRGCAVSLGIMEHGAGSEGTFAVFSELYRRPACLAGYEPSCCEAEPTQRKNAADFCCT